MSGEDGSEEYRFQSDSGTDEKRKEKIRDVGQRLEKRFQTSLKPLAGILIVLILVTGTVYLSSDIGSLFNSTDQPDKPDIEGEIIEVKIGNRYAQPQRPTISREDGIRFVNTGDYALELSFDRDIETFVLEPGEEKTVDISSITYYTANPTDTDARLIKAGVNIDQN